MVDTLLPELLVQTFPPVFIVPAPVNTFVAVDLTTLLAAKTIVPEPIDRAAADPD